MDNVDISNKEVEHVALLEQRWRESAVGVMTDGWDIEEESQYLAKVLVSSVMRGVVTVDELRGGVAWVNALDAEASTRQSADITEGDYRWERTARRLMHQAGRLALDDLKNKRKRTITFSRYNRDKQEEL